MLITILEQNAAGDLGWYKQSPDPVIAPATIATAVAFVPVTPEAPLPATSQAPVFAVAVMATAVAFVAVDQKPPPSVTAPAPVVSVAQSPTSYAFVAVELKAPPLAVSPPPVIATPVTPGDFAAPVFPPAVVVVLTYWTPRYPDRFDAPSITPSTVTAPLGVPGTYLPLANSGVIVSAPATQATPVAYVPAINRWGLDGSWRGDYPDQVSRPPPPEGWYCRPAFTTGAFEWLPSVPASVVITPRAADFPATAYVPAVSRWGLDGAWRGAYPAHVSRLITPEGWYARPKFVAGEFEWLPSVPSAVVVTPRATEFPALAYVPALGRLALEGDWRPWCADPIARAWTPGTAAVRPLVIEQGVAWRGSITDVVRALTAPPSSSVAPVVADGTFSWRQSASDVVRLVAAPTSMLAVPVAPPGRIAWWPVYPSVLRATVVIPSCGIIKRFDTSTPAPFPWLCDIVLPLAAQDHVRVSAVDPEPVPPYNRPVTAERVYEITWAGITHSLVGPETSQPYIASAQSDLVYVPWVIPSGGTFVFVPVVPPPPPPRPTPSVGGTPMGMGGGGGWAPPQLGDDCYWDEEGQRWCPRSELYVAPDRDARAAPVALGAVPPAPKSILKPLLVDLIVPGAASFATTKAGGALGGKLGGDKGRAAGVVGTFVATLLTTKGEGRTATVAGSGIAALDTLVGLYAKAKKGGVKAPTAIRILSEKAFTDRIVARRAPVQVSSTEEDVRGKSGRMYRVLVIRYFIEGEPGRLWTYQEVRIITDGTVDITGTLLERLSPQ